MAKYANSGKSGIAAFEIGDDYIIVRFKDGKAYTYNYRHPGKVHVEQMKVLATEGKGLATYINKHVREDYAQ